jgi:hypothetical protein
LLQSWQIRKEKFNLRHTILEDFQQGFKDVSSQLGIEIHPHLSEPSLLTDVQKLESKTSTLMLSVAESQKEYWQNIILHILKMQ